MFSFKKIRSVTKKKSFNSFYLSVLFILTLILILFNKADYFLVNKIKYIGVDVITPITSIISSPVTFSTNLVSRVNNIKYLEQDNLKLKEEILRLKKWQTLAIKNTRENRVFKKLLNSTSNDVEVIKTASVISHLKDFYSNTATINAGLNSNIRKDLAVINEKGLVGRTIIVSNKHSKILLINDQNASIPVKIISDKAYAMVKGSLDGKYLISSFLKDNKMPKVGDLLVTSGNAKIFPRDILVGKVVKVNKDHFIALPYVDFNNLDYVQVIKSK